MSSKSFVLDLRRCIARLTRLFRVCFYANPFETNCHYRAIELKELFVISIRKYRSCRNDQLAVTQSDGRLGFGIKQISSRRGIEMHGLAVNVRP